jgi:hypothetical protein
MAKIPAGIIVLWPGAHSAIAGMDGWSRETSLDGRFPKGRISGTAANAGATSHNHNASAHTHPATAAHTHSVTTGLRLNNQHPNAAEYGTRGGNWRNDFGPTSHTHTDTSGSATPSGASGSTTPTWENTTTDPLNYEMIAIVSDGEPAGFPDDCVVYYNASNKSSPSAPDDWVHHTASAGRFIKAPSSSTGNGGTTNNAGHLHAGTTHPHNAVSGNHDHAGGTMTGTRNGFTSTATPNNHWPSPYWVWTMIWPEPHDHDWDINAGGTGSASSTASPNTASETDVPPYHVLLGIQNTSGADNWLEEAIVMWMGNTSASPDDWTLCDGGNNKSGNATPNLDGKYVQMWVSGGGNINATGGDAGHGHSNPSGHTHPANAHTHSFPGGVTGETGHSNTDKSHYWPNPQFQPPSTYDASARSSWHWHTANNSASVSGTYGSTTQDVGTTSNTEPEYRTVGYLSAPPEPSSGNVAMFGAAF